MWLKGQATQSTIVDRLTKLAAGEISDDVGNTVPIGDRWIRHTVGQDFLVSPAASKVALPVMAMRAGYFQHGNGEAANCDYLAGNFARVSSIATAAPTGVTRWVVFLTVNTPNTVAGTYSTAVVRIQVLNADTGASLTNTTVNPSAAGVITVSWTGGSVQITMGNTETGILRSNNNATSDSPGALVRFFSATYLGGIDFWPMEYRRYPTESSAFTVAPPGAAGVDYDKDVRVVTGFQTGTTTTARPRYMNVKGGWGYGLGIKTNTGLGGGALYSVSWNVYGMGLHLSLNGSQYLQAEINGGSGARADSGVRTRIQGVRETQWLRMFTGTPLAGTAVQYWMCVKSDRVIVVLNGDPGTGGVLTVAGVWKFTPIDPTNDLFPWAWSGNVQGYQTDAFPGGAFLPSRGIPLVAQLAAASGFGLPASRDWGTGYMRTDCAMPTNNGGTNSPSSTSGFDGEDDNGGGEGNAITVATAGILNTVRNNTGQAIGGNPNTVQNPGTFSSWPTLGNPGMYGSGNSDASISGYVDYGRPMPHTEPKPAAADTRWWLYGQVYTDAPSAQSGANYVTNKVRGKLSDKILLLPSSGWSSGDEITDTVTGKTYFLVQADYAGNGLGRLRIGPNTYAIGLAIEEAA